MPKMFCRCAASMILTTIVAMLSSCSQLPTSPEPSSERPVAPWSTQGPPNAYGATDEDFASGDQETPQAWDATRSQRAATVAVAAMNDFVRTGDDGWFARLAVHLSASARLAFENTDPAKIPATKVIGNISAMPSANGWLAQVVISTNAGRYIVLMSPRDLDGWIVERIAPIAAAH